MLKIRRPLGRLIFNMGIAIPGKTVFLIETAPWLLWVVYMPIFVSLFTGAGQSGGAPNASEVPNMVPKVPKHNNTLMNIFIGVFREL